MEHFELVDLEYEIKRGKRGNHGWREKDPWEIFPMSHRRAGISAVSKDLSSRNQTSESQNVYKIDDFGLSKSELFFLRFLTF